MKKILVVGSRGLLGLNFINSCFKKYQIYATFFKNEHFRRIENVKYLPLDIRDKNKVASLIRKIKPNFLVHAASQGDVDLCEKNKKEAYLVNVTGTQNIAVSCQKNNVKLIYLSTNAIYDGKNPPYSEISKPSPINYYGFTKLEGERVVSEICKDFMVLRLNTMYGWNDQNERNNPATWVIQKLKNREEIKVVNDIYNNHLYVVSAINILDKVINNWRSREYFNIAGGECIDRFQFALKITKVFDIDQQLIESVNSSYFPTIAPRPKNTCFNTQKMTRLLKNQPWSLEEGLIHMKNNPIP